MTKKKVILFFFILLSMICSFSVTSQAKGKGYKVSGKTVTIVAKNKEAVGAKIKEAISYIESKRKGTEIYTVKIPKGTYKLEKDIHIYGNIILDCTGVTLTYTPKEGNMLMLGDGATNPTNKNLKGYGNKKYWNITIKGGTWVGNNKGKGTLIRMAHTKNVTLEKCTLKGGGCEHQIEVAAIDGFTVKNCTFRDAKPINKNGNNEALQLDMPCSSNTFKGVVLDGTPMKNVLVTGNTFKNVTRGVGTHSMLSGSYHKNIKITNNIFTDVKGESIIALTYYNCEISNNTIKNCGAGIICQYFKPYVKAVYNTTYDGKKKVNGKILHDAKTVIKNNDIEIVPSKGADEPVGIKVYGCNLKKDTTAIVAKSPDKIKKGDYYISGVTVINNKIKTCGHGIHFMDARNSTISNNTITSTKSNSDLDGIFIELESTNLTITNNIINKPSRYGIFFRYYSSAKEVSNNQITSSGKYAIGVYDHSKVTGVILGNKIKKSKLNSIFLNKNSTVKDIFKNTIETSGKYAIALIDKSQITGSINNNKISDSDWSGISVANNASVNAITSNIIVNSKRKGICVESGGSVKTSITGNTIDKTQQEGISIKSGNKNVEISGNTITNTKQTPILVK